MKTVIIRPPIAVFEDPEFCEMKTYEKTYEGCDYIDDEIGNICTLFHELLDYRNENKKCVKCSQCKDLFKQSLSEDENAQRIRKNSP